MDLVRSKVWDGVNQSPAWTAKADGPLAGTIVYQPKLISESGRMSAMPLVAVVVATCNRPQLLAERSLASVKNQTRLPDLLVVVDDSDQDMRDKNRAAIPAIPATKTTYMENRRTPGAAGAWNTALSYLYGVAPHAFVAILDDDDSWEPRYLHLCEEAASRYNLDMVASGITYHGPVTKLLDSPDRLSVADLLVRNTNIQGSNIFARLRKLLEAGGFDEALTSTTDRDICIRLADLGTVRYGAIPGHMVHHYAENDRPRLSTPGAAAKRAGLEYFFRKYGGRMSKAEEAAFMQRCRSLFRCDPATTIRLPPPVQPDDSPNVEGHLNLVVGSITSPDVAPTARLLDSLCSNFGNRSDVTLKVVLLENGGRQAGDALRNAIKRASKRGLDVTLKTFKDQLDGRKSIAASRTILQRHLFSEAAPMAGAVVWILDDDMVLESLEYGPEGMAGRRNVDYITGIKRLKETGADVVICQETGDPPLPAAGCIRTQMVDLYHNLHRMAGLRPDDPYPDLSRENRNSRLGRRDYYYDLSRLETDRLELPFWFEADGTTAQAFEDMVSRLPGMLSGIQVFRPLTRAESGDHASTIPSISRGPATLVFDIGALRDFPNTVPAIRGADTRRSDMVWSILNRFVAGRDTVRAPLPVRQIREATCPRMNLDCILQDIRGHALYSALQDLFGAQQRGPCGVHFDERQTRRAVDSYKRYFRERVHAFELNFVRIMGVLSVLRPSYRHDARGTTPWWLESPKYTASAAKLQRFVESLASVYTDARLGEFRRQAADIDAHAIEQYIADMPGAVDLHRADTPLPADALRRDAEAYTRSEFATGPLTYLGMGEEGVAFTDGRLVYKHFYHWRIRGHRAAFLRSLAGKLSGYKTLPDILEVRQRDAHTVAVYPYEEGTRYDGGHLDGLLTLLRECRHAKIACRNIHPDNILVTKSGLRFIDFGVDVVSAGTGEFEQMCRRAFLACRFAFRSDLRLLMRRAIYDDTLAELTGLDLFKNALDPRGLDDLLYAPMERMVAEQRPGSVLDYGCGDGRLAERLVGRGIRTVGYDPDPACIKRCPANSRVTYGDANLRERLLADSARFDVVVCSRVLCIIGDDSEVGDILCDMGRLVATSGDVFVTVCNPFYLGVSTELAEKHLPAGFGYGDTFHYTKTLAVNGNRRTEVHRSCAAYRHIFAKAGLAVREVREFDGVDTTAVLPASDHLVFRLAPLAPSGVSLLIKTCFAEWRLIERLVRHMVRQLEGPRMFAEKVIVVDSHKGPFLRQYDHPDRKAHRAAMERLLCDGVVDRVVYAPDDPEVIRSTYKRWFGAESTETRSGNGQQLFATLFGFDSCTGEYVLQVDSDLLIVRADHEHDYLAEMKGVLCNDPGALFVSLGICRAEAEPYTHEGPDGNWRVEVRGCLYDRRRIESVLPVPNYTKDGRFELAWHRAFDRFMHDYRSYRGGDPKTAFMHVPNDRKTRVDELLDMAGAVERGHVPEVQLGRVELAGSAGDWAGPRRSEPYVFVVCARNVAHGRFKRCVQSMVAQRGAKWGAVVIDDASTNGLADYAEMLLADYADRVTLIRNERWRGTLRNTWNAVTQVCVDPETVIITLDADDALAGNHVLERIKAEYDDGADVTVGSMLRFDKEASYPANLDHPRRRDSNVWQHLRTFKKRLFDAIDVEDLKIDGEWIGKANDWAFMVPIVEMASSPRHILDQLYLYEPSVPKDEKHRQERDRIIERILSKAPYAKLVS